jgi:hypothetical protein
MQEHPIEEFKVINKKITDEIEIGFDELGDITTVTAEDLDTLISMMHIIKLLKPIKE